MREHSFQDRRQRIERELGGSSDEQRRLREQILGHVRRADSRLSRFRTTLTEEWRRTREGAYGRP